MRFSLMTEPQTGGTYEDLLELARWAEAVGMTSFARSDHYYSNRRPRPAATDAFATLAGLARETSSIRLGVLVTPITFRHPAVIAKSAATIDQMAGGRFDLGVGTGWMELEHTAFGLPFPNSHERLARLSEALQYLRAALSGKAAEFRGEYYSLDAEVRPASTGIRIIVGGSGGVKTPTLAGRHADEYNHFIGGPEDIAPKVGVMRQAAEQSGRDPAWVEVTVMGPMIAGRDESEYREKLARAAADRDLEPAELERRWEANGIPLGPPDRIAECMAALEAVGVTRYYLQWMDASDLEGLKSAWEAIPT